VLDEIVRAGEEAFADKVRGRTFAVRARRSGQHSFRSHDVEVALGAALDRNARVNLDRPDVTVHVEVRPDEAFLFSDIIDGCGGLPLLSQRHAVALVSGGFESAVAAWYMLKRGVALDFVLCNLAGAAYERAVIGVMKVLADSWSYGTRPRLFVVDFEPMVEALRRDIEPRYVQVVLKRLMYRAGLRIAHQRRAEAIITGEAVGQVSSQTLANLRAIDEVATLPVLRPLIGFDKEEIVACARRIGTAPLSAAIQEYCQLVRRKPATAAQPETIRAEEAKIDLALLDTLVEARKTIDLRSVREDDLVLPYLFKEEIPSGAVVIDCRPDAQFRAWHYPGAVHMELEELLGSFRKLDRMSTYVVCCPLGMQSAMAAEKMQAAGYEAYSFKGGIPRLREYALSCGRVS
jgi:thiamine biosynthesis protein ThiI